MLVPMSEEQHGPHARVAWYMVFVLALTVMLANLDQRVISLLIQPIKTDLHLSDTGVSLLIGPAFALFYTLIGIPLARFVDRSSRKHILAAGLAVWSLATACCGLARSFTQLFVARVLVGAGEAVNGPATFSMIADAFPRERLPRAIAAMQLGVTAGSGLALLVGGLVVGALVGHPWQWVFIAVGLPGLAVAVLILTTLREPLRRAPAASASAVQLSEVLRYLIGRWRVFVPMLLGLTFGAISLGAANWMPEVFRRSYGWSTSHTAMVTGVTELIAQTLGLYVGVRWVERYDRQHRPEAPLRVAVIARAIALPAAIAWPLMPDPAWAVALFAVGGFTLGMGGASQNAALQIITPGRMRGQVTAIYLFLFNVVGYGLGPLVAALLTDYGFQAEGQLRYALASLAAIVGPLGLAFIALGVRPYVRELARL